MPALRFNHYNIRAQQPHLDAIRDFYVDIVGMHVGWRPPFDFGGYWLYLGDQAVLHLVDGSPVKAGAGQIDHVAFTCSGLPQLEERLSQAGIAYRKSTVPGTTQVQLFAHDPVGNGVEFNFASADA